MTCSRIALVSVFLKDGIVEFASKLVSLGWDIVSTGGTAKTLNEAGIKTMPMEEVTGNPEIFGGRIKSISFQIESGILFDRLNPLHLQEAQTLGIRPIDMVVSNFYPFPELGG